MDNNTAAWLIPLLTLIGNTFITTIIGLIIKTYFTKYLNKKNKEIEEQQKNFEELEKRRLADRRQDLKDDIIASISHGIEPITKKIEKIDERLEKVEDGTLSTLRNDILTCYYRCVEKGYRNDYDYQNMHHMYESYAELNGNSYVADIMDRFDELLTKEEFNKKKVTKKSIKKTSKKNSEVKENK